MDGPTLTVRIVDGGTTGGGGLSGGGGGSMPTRGGRASLPGGGPGNAVGKRAGSKATQTATQTAGRTAAKQGASTAARSAIGSQAAGLASRAGTAAIGGGELAAARGLAKVAASAGPAGIAIAALAAVVVGTVVAVKKFSGFMEREAQRLSDVSGKLAGVTAAIEVREELAQLRRDRRRADRLGDEMARIAEINSGLRELWLEVKETILVPLLEIAADIVIPLLQGFLDNMITIVAAIPGLEDVAKTLREIRDGTGEREEDPAWDIIFPGMGARGRMPGMRAGAAPPPGVPGDLAPMGLGGAGV